MIQKVRASDRMSRSDIALPLPFPPTELQVMMGEVANGLCESKNLNLLAVGVANGLAGQFVRLPVCGTSKWWYFNAVRGSISNMACV